MKDWKGNPICGSDGEELTAKQIFLLLWEVMEAKSTGDKRNSKYYPLVKYLHESCAYCHLFVYKSHCISSLGNPCPIHYKGMTCVNDRHPYWQARQGKPAGLYKMVSLIHAAPDIVPEEQQ